MRMAALLLNSVSFLRGIYNLLKPSPTKTKYGIPLPSKCHVVISDEQIGDRTLVIIGDVHGCFDELQELIQQAENVSQTNDLFLIFVGDMLNKGPKNLEVLTLLRDLSSQGRAAAVKGNHEEALLREYRLMSGDKDYQLREKYKYLHSFSQDDFIFLHNLPYSLSIPKINSIVVHAGLLPDIPLRHQSLIDLCHMRNIVYKPGLWGPVAIAHSKPDKGVAWSSQWHGPQHIYFGHDALRGLQIMPFSTGLDTGCVYGLSLTGVVISNTGQRQFVSVKAKSSYY